MPDWGVGYQCVTHPFAANSSRSCDKKLSARLACLRHAANVQPEPGSNSQKKPTPTWRSEGSKEIDQVCISITLLLSNGLWLEVRGLSPDATASVWEGENGVKRPTSVWPSSRRTHFSKQLRWISDLRTLPIRTKIGRLRDRRAHTIIHKRNVQHILNRL